MVIPSQETLRCLRLNRQDVINKFYRQNSIWTTQIQRIFEITWQISESLGRKWSIRTNNHRQILSPLFRPKASLCQISKLVMRQINLRIARRIIRISWTPSTSLRTASYLAKIKAEPTKKRSWRHWLKKVCQRHPSRSLLNKKLLNLTMMLTIQPQQQNLQPQAILLTSLISSVCYKQARMLFKKPTCQRIKNYSKLDSLNPCKT